MSGLVEGMSPLFSSRLFSRFVRSRVRPSRRAMPLLLGATLVGCLSASPAFCQSTFSGDIAGTVTDSTGAVVPNADIEARENGTGATVKVRSGGTGSYRVPALNPGIYTLTVTTSGFKAQSLPVVVGVGQVSRADVKLGISGDLQVVEVTDAAPLLQTENGSIATTFTGAQIANTPNPGDDFTYIAQTSPGAIMSTRDSQGGVGNYSSFGLPPTSNLNTINGENENDPFVNSANVGAFNMLLGNNDVAEVTVVSNGGAEYGTLGGAQVNGITKSGSDQFHGNARYGWNGRVLNANNFFNVRNDTPRPFDNVNQWATSLGGPIRRGKTFFFIDFEGLRIILPTSNLAVIPSPSFEALALASVPASEVQFYQQMFNLYNSAPGASRATPVTGDSDLLQFQSTPTTPENEWLLAGRVDHVLGAKDRLFAHVRIDHGFQNFYTDPINPQFNVGAYEPMYDGQANENHVFSANLINQFLASSMYYGGLVPSNPKALALFPGSLSFQGDLPLSSLGGIEFILPTGRNVTQYSLSDSLTWTKGSHSLKFGADFKRDDITDYDVGYQTSPNFASEARSDFLAGNSTVLLQNFPTRPSEPIALYTLGFFAADQWKVRPNLALTAGLRVEHFSNPICTVDCISRFTTNFAATSSSPGTPYNAMIASGRHQAFSAYQSYQIEPRVGFSWSPFGAGSSSVFRGGFGIFSDYFPAQIVDNTLSNIPSVAGFLVAGNLLDPSASGSATSFAAASAKAFQAGFKTGGSYTSISQAVSNAGGVFNLPSFNNTNSDLHYPTYEEWNLEVQQGIGRTSVFSIRYVGDHGYHEFVENNSVNAYNNPSISGINFAGLPLLPQNPSFSDATEGQSIANSHYDGLIISGTNRSKYLTVQVNYAWSHTLDEISNGGLYTVHSASIIGPLNPFNLRQNNYGNADYDVRNSVTGSYVFTIPSYRTLQALTGGWQLSGAVFANTGFPFSVNDSGTAGNLSAQNYGSTILADQFQYGPIKCTASATNTPCLNSSQFGTATEFGSQRRNQLFGPGFINTDLTVLKSIKLPFLEFAPFEVGAQFFNVLNHPNFTHPGSDIANSQFFGLITGTVSTPTSLLGENLGGDASPRMIELTARVKF